MDDSGSVTLMSLAGIFYGTVIGTLLSLLTLGYEVRRFAVSYKGASINDFRNFLYFWTPSPLVRIWN